MNICHYIHINFPRHSLHSKGHLLLSEASVIFFKSALQIKLCSHNGETQEDIGRRNSDREVGMGFSSHWPPGTARPQPPCTHPRGLSGLQHRGMAHPGSLSLSVLNQLASGSPPSSDIGCAVGMSDAYSDYGQSAHQAGGQ